jgi:Helix-turn-helix domain
MQICLKLRYAAIYVSRGCTYCINLLHALRAGGARGLGPPFAAPYDETGTLLRREYKDSAMAMPHGTACARSIRDQARDQGASEWEVVQAINAHCSVSLLRAHRIAAGWTLVEMTERLRVFLREAGQSCAELAHQRVSCWERGADVPSPRYLDALCQLYQTRPDRLGFGHDYSDEARDSRTVSSTARRQNLAHGGPVSYAGESSIKDGEVMQRRQLLHMLGSYSGLALSAQLFEALKSVRERSDRLLETQSVNTSSVDNWEEIPYNYGKLQLTVPAHEFLASIICDFADLQSILSRRQPLEIQKRLYRVMAQLAGLIAIGINDVSRGQEAASWLHTARLAAEETGDRELRAWIVARKAMLYLWYERPVERAADLARVAQMMAGRTPTVSGSLAAAMEARAQARLGRKREALAAVSRAEEIFNRLSPGDVEPSILGFDVHRLRWCQQNALTTLGETGAAMKMQNDARRLSDIDLVLVQLDRASCLIQEGYLDHGYQVAGEAIVSLPPESRSGLIAHRARGIAAMARPDKHRLPAVRGFDEILRLDRNR